MTREDGSVVPWIDENLHPYTGDWISRSMLEVAENGTWSEKHGGRERDEDYNHSTFCDLVISGLVGVRPCSGSCLEVNPLLPQDRWDFFCLDGMRYHGHVITIVWDRSGRKYAAGRGLSILVDGEPVAGRETLGRIVVDVDDLPSA